MGEGKEGFNQNQRDNALEEAAASINMQHLTSDILIGHQHKHGLRYFFCRTNPLAGQDGGSVVDNSIAL